MKYFADITGQRFGRLVALSREGLTRLGAVTWNCVCDCGTELIVKGSSLRSGNTSSCGCLCRDRTSETHLKHGQTYPKKTSEYLCWRNMLTRCQYAKNKDYPRYGGRGITVCERWQVFANFYEDMGPSNGLTIERKDNDGPYCPENCCWIPRSKQQENTRKNIPLTAFGKTRFVWEWARELGISRQKIRNRLVHGRSPEEALSLKRLERGGIPFCG